MKRYRYILAALLTLHTSLQLSAQDTLYIRYDDRFKATASLTSAMPTPSKSEARR